jgi:hypothetical protein
MEEKELARLREAIARSEAARVEDQVWRPDLTATRERIEALLLRHTGIATAKEEFDAIAAEERTRVEGMAASQRDASATASRARASQLSAMSASRIQDFQTMTGIDNLPGDRQSILLQTPFEVSVIGAAMTDHSIVPGASYARFEFPPRRVGGTRTHFSYVWQNPTNRYAIINAHGYAILDGHIAVDTDGGFFAGSRMAQIKVLACMWLHDWGQEPLLASSQTTRNLVTELKVDAGTMFDDWTSASADVFRGVDLERYNYIMKPHGTVGLVIEVDLECTTGDNEGRVSADFAEGNHQMASPGVLVQVIS